MNERSSLIRPVRPRPQRDKLSSPAASAPSWSKDLLDDPPQDRRSDFQHNTNYHYNRQGTNFNHPSYRHEPISTNMRNNISREDVDLIQMEDEGENLSSTERTNEIQLAPPPQSNPFNSSSTVSKLQKRIHGRQNLNMQSIVMDDEEEDDDDDSDMEEETRLLDLTSLEMETIHHHDVSSSFSTDPSSNHANATTLNMPLHDLTASTHTKQIMNPMQQYSADMDPFHKLPQRNDSNMNGVTTSSIRNNGTKMVNHHTNTISDQQTSIHHIHYSPPRNIKDSNVEEMKYTPTRGGTSNVIVTHAKRAVSTLFGSSVVVQNQSYPQDISNSKTYTSNISLLDTIDNQENHIQLPSVDINTMKHRHVPNQTFHKSPSSSSDTAKSWFGERNTRIQAIPSRMSSSMPSSDDSYLHHDETRDKSWNVSTPPSLSAMHTPSYNTRLFLRERVFRGKLASSSWCDRFLKDLNWLNLGLCISYGLSTAAATVPITLIPTIAMDVLQKSIMVNNNDDHQENVNIEALITVFASKVTMYAVLGTAFGKFINGPLGDILGARRVACFYALLVSISLMVLSFSGGEWSVIYCCAAIEYYQSVQWPCAAIILAAHYGKDDKQSSTSSEKGHGLQSMPEHVVGDYEKGIYIVSMGSRVGSLLASISVTMLLRYQNDSWRFVARLAAMGSLLSCLIYYFLLTDSPGKLHDPQNPIKESFNDIARRNFTHKLNRRFSSQGILALLLDKLTILASLGFNMFRNNILPSMKNVLTNATFWTVAISHSGGIMVNSSVRILGTYFRDTSFGTISGNLAGFVNLSLSVGVLVGLAIGGNAFANLSNNARARKKMVANLYTMTVAMCYTLSFLAVPFVRRSLHSVTLVAVLQMIASFFMGAGVAVQVYCIPAIVGCTFGINKGIYAAYTDGVACIISSWVWSVVGGAVEEGNPQGSGWVYGWAGIALLVVLAGLLMVAFVEHYFCRGGWINRLRTSNISTSDKNGTMHSMNSYKDIPLPPMSTPESIRRRVWDSRPNLFRSSNPIHRGPEVHSILSLGEDNEDDDDDDDDVSTIVFEDINSPIDYSDIENAREPLQDPIEVKQRIRRLLKHAGNELCCDCHAPDPRWVSIIKPNKIGLSHRGASSPVPYHIGCFICAECASSHRKLGTQLVLVRNLENDSFKHDDLVALKQGGNTEVNRIYEAYLNDASAKPPPASLSSHRDLFIKTKYEKKMWYKFESNAGSGEDLSVELTSTKTKSVFDTAAPFDAKTRDEYERFVRNERDSDSQISPKINLLSNDDDSFSSDDSENWQIQMSSSTNVTRQGLEDLMDL